MTDIKQYLGDMVWSEDDALPYQLESLSSAMLRICGMAYHTRDERKPELKIDCGDCIWEVYPQWVICFSYPGNNSIYKRNK